MTSPPQPTTNDILASTRAATPKIGVVVCSQRSPRIGNQVGKLVFSTLKSFQHSISPHESGLSTYELSLIDLADHPLPFFDEPVIPQMITNPLDYHHKHTQAWSKLISSYSAFVFVTPQYNWSFPANLKNAIDYLFNEWVGKTAMIVSYGGHGGGKSADQLKQVLQAVRINVVEKTVGLSFPKEGEDGKGFLKKATVGKDLGLQDRRGESGEVWASEMRDVQDIFVELVGMLTADGREKER